MSKVLRIGRQGKIEPVKSAKQKGVAGGEDLDTRIALIQMLIPLGFQAVEEVLQQEVIGPGGAALCAR